MEAKLRPCKKRLMMPKGQSEAVNRRLDNTMVKIERTKGHIYNDLQNITQKTKNQGYTVFKLFLMKYMTSIYECDHRRLGTGTFFCEFLVNIFFFYTYPTVHV